MKHKKIFNNERLKFHFFGHVGLQKVPWKATQGCHKTKQQRTSTCCLKGAYDKDRIGLQPRPRRIIWIGETRNEVFKLQSQILTEISMKRQKY